MEIQYLLNNLTINEEVQNKMVEDLKGTNNIVFVASNFSNATLNDHEFQNQLMWFHNIGLDFAKSYIIDDRIGEYTASELLKDADIVFLNDGNPIDQMKSINSYGLKDEIGNIKNIIGLGYGACNLAVDVRLSKCEEKNINEHINYHGLGLNNINVEPHFDFDNLTHNSKELFPRSIMNEVLCMTPDAAVRISDNVTYINSCYLLKDGKIEEIKTKSK